MTDAITKKWIRNASDERASENGCRFDEDRGQHVLDFARKYLRLYEGDKAGELLDPMPWQVEVTMRLFGWVRHSERWGREIRRFRSATIFVPKKCGKSPTLSWWGLYLLCADGEMGQKVYFGAKDGQQAREIAGKHAAEMVMASPQISKVCTVNKTLLQITHEPSRSILKPISSSDSKAQKAKEGLNGSILIDETHVVDREFMGRISRAGISRSEPFVIEVSTAGDDPECYGRERYDYGKRVEAGEEEDDSFFFISYEAPQDLTDEDLAADPAKYGRMANPAWGYTVGEEEYLADYNSSKASMTELARFKKYRLNIWQQVSNPWLDMGDWTRCGREYGEADLLGRPCGGGLDLAKTRDTTSLALIFPDDDGTFRQLVYFWLPRQRAQAMAHLVKYLEWERGGWLTLTPGEVVDYAFVRKALNDIRGKFDLQKLFFDGTYAAQLVQRLTEEDGWAIETCVEFRQTIMSFAGPTAAYERAVIDEKLHHNGNPLFTWQAGNVRVKSDVNENIRPVKQKHGDTRTIDGIVAAIMGFEAARTVENVGWFTPNMMRD